MVMDRETYENGKPIVAVDEPYSWVKGEARDLVSLFSDVESVEAIGNPLSWVKEGSGTKLQFLPCVEAIGNPSQIHPNAWAFIRGFEILMEYLGHKPLLEVFFFTFFQVKGVRKRGLVTLNSVQGKTLFILYRQSYKDFKRMFIKVGCVEEQFPFYLDEFGLERFPLYWYSEPVQILGMSKVSEESAMVIDFLEQYMCTKEALSLAMLFKWEKEREYVERYLETTTGGLKNFFKNRSERGHSASNVVKTEEGVVVNQPSERKKPISMKRRRAEEGGLGKGKVIDLTSSKCCGKEVSLEEVKGFAEKQKKLHGYVGEKDFTSMYAARLLCLGRYEELRAREEAGQKKEQITDVQKLLELERKLQVFGEQLSLKEKEVQGLKADVEQLKGKLQKFDKEKIELEARVVELCVQKKEAETSKEDHGYSMMEAGFERAQKQAEYFFPGLKFDKLDPIKVVHNGTLVDDDEVDLEGSGDHNSEE
ncbi:hypothetical protein PIB30_018116 [Stylosanthes scabra]|uniref:Uncharacterized protein n=1 Tax=Stylosanthes scabra TaxID=79078 RepID=A0ABU6Z6U0_9FABA|nr:hypothetical protein [Stylosanthes scabra]